MTSLLWQEGSLVDCMWQYAKLTLAMLQQLGRSGLDSRHWSKCGIYTLTVPPLDVDDPILPFTAQ
ncbi:hypothetical protein [uncultured Roseobacter sp.]|uniref:hypothetical protein n=1 Tax=uncultured Roseobacter sp. TaxID=114847 RepID=UPI0026044042|nr:hypothetical protein [uncultured Roseobacter sp.]